MRIAKHFSNDGPSSEENSDEGFNIKKSLKPFIRTSQNKLGWGTKVARLVERQNSYISTTTATTTGTWNSTQTKSDLPDSQSNDGILEAESNVLAKKSPPKTPPGRETACADESFRSPEDDMPMNSKNSTLYTSKLEVYRYDSDGESEHEVRQEAKRSLPKGTESKVRSVPRSPGSNRQSKDKTTNSITAPQDREFVAINMNDAEDKEDSAFQDVEVVTRPISPLPPTNEPNVRELTYVALSPINFRNVLSKGQNQDIYLIPKGTKEEDEEAPFEPTSAESMKNDGLGDVGETSTAGASSDCAGDSDPDESNNPSPEDSDEKKSGEEEGTASRSKSIMKILFACVLAIGVAVTIPFSMNFTASAGAIVETSAPSLSQAPSHVPSSNPSIYPTISNMPTTAPSGHPTISISPSLFPSISFAPTTMPSILPTVSMEPSENPSEVPSLSPSSNPSKSPSTSPTVSMAPSSSPSSSPSVSPSTTPSQVPTRTFRPSSSPSHSPTNFPTRRPTPSPTRQPSSSPTDSPSRPPITPPKPANVDNAFKIRLYWNESYFWQESKNETWWCMECVKCEEYGNMDAHHHGCKSYGTGNENRCQAGDSVWIRDCRDRGNRFNIQGTADNGFMLRIATTDLCVERIKEQHPFLFIQPCDRGSSYQRFLPWNDSSKFELRPVLYRGQPEAQSECVSQLHHPKSHELVALHNCAMSREYETLFWQKYETAT